MAWANGIASFGENFAKARVARQEADLKEKAYEDKLKKETRDNAIAMQAANIKQGLANQKEIGAAVDKIPAVDPVLTNQWKSKYAAHQEALGNEAVLTQLTVRTPEEIAKYNKYAEDVTQFKDKSLSALAANQTNVNEWKTLSPRERANTAFMGNTPLERKISEITLYSSDPSNYNYRDKVTKNLYEEDDNPANPGLEIITKIDPAKDLKGFDQAAIDEGIKNGSILYDDATKQFSIKFKQKLGTTTWDGTFYHKVADAPDSDKIWGKTQANVVDDRGGLNDNFIINPGNPVITKEKIKDFPNKEKKIETTYVNVPEIRKNTSMYYKAGAEALLSSDLRDMSQLQSFLQTKLQRGNESLADWIKLHPTIEEQKDFIANKLFEIDMETKLSSSTDQYSNRPATEEDVKFGRANKVGQSVYYRQKSEDVATPKVENAGRGGDDNKPTAGEKAQQAFDNLIAKRIKKGEAIKGKDGLYLKVTNGKGSLYRIDATGLKIPVDTTGDSLQDMINTIGGTIEVDNTGRKKIK
jgi:hypothetical protein